MGNGFRSSCGSNDLNDADCFHRLAAAIKKRIPLLKTTNALRLVNGAGDRLEGLVIEQYQRHFVIHVFQPHWLLKIPLIQEFLQKHYPIVYLIVKERTSPNGRSLDNPRVKILVNKSDSRTIVEEYGLKFEVDLNDTVNTGLFLDMRRNRHIVGQMAAHKEALNCFAYTCSFGVHCRWHGAKRVVNLDISRRILCRGTKNYALNQIPASAEEFIPADALRYLSAAVKRHNQFDMVILDPPSFARSKGKIFTVKKAMPVLIEHALAVLRPKGILFTAVNLSSLGRKQLGEWIQRAARQKGISIARMTPMGQDSDFPQSDSPMAAVLTQFPP